MGTWRVWGVEGHVRLRLGEGLGMWILKDLLQKWVLGDVGTWGRRGLEELREMERLIDMWGHLEGRG